MNDFNKSAKSALIAEKLGPAFQDSGSESDDLLLIYIFFRCCGNILSFDKFKWLQAGKIKTPTEEYNFINLGDYFKDFYALQIDHGQAQLITNFETDIESKIDKLITNAKANKLETKLETSSNPLHMDPSSDPTLLNSILNQGLKPNQLKKAAKRKERADAAASGAASAAQGGGSKKIKMTKKKNNKKKTTRNKKKKLTRKIRK
jgi:hypothetical protein